MRLGFHFSRELAPSLLDDSLQAFRRFSGTYCELHPTTELLFWYEPQYDYLYNKYFGAVSDTPICLLGPEIRSRSALGTDFLRVATSYLPIPLSYYGKTWYSYLEALYFARCDRLFLVRDVQSPTYARVLPPHTLVYEYNPLSGVYGKPWRSAAVQP